MIFTLIENFSYVTQAPKFVEIQTNDPESIQNFVNELDELNIYNHLPLLFLIYINDLPLVSNVFNMVMYADDTTLFCNMYNNVDEHVINN